MKLVTLFIRNRSSNCYRRTFYSVAYRYKTSIVWTPAMSHLRPLNPDPETPWTNILRYSAMWQYILPHIFLLGHCRLSISFQRRGLSLFL